MTPLTDNTAKVKEREKCSVDGCDLLQRNKGKNRKGETIWGTTCSIHHKFGKTETANDFFERLKINNNECSVCGWNEAPCDRHRIDPKLGYIENNVKVLCPNCHRAMHHKTQSIPQLK